MSRSRIWYAAILLLAIIALSIAFAGCAQTPRQSYVNRVRAVCGDRIANLYAVHKWHDRDYAQDSIMITCITFGDPQQSR